MAKMYVGKHIGYIWDCLLRDLVNQEDTISPRGQLTSELQNVTLELSDPIFNVLIHKVRNVSYRFMVAEWLWIWFGRDDVATISKYNSHIAKFSDNGIDFNGAYGNAIKPYWDSTRELINDDADTRQAVIQIYKRPKRPTKDVPCTLSMQFLLREDLLYLTVNMRSSDVWLGLPYDVFNFTMFQNIMAMQLGTRVGMFTMNLGSSHLYKRNGQKAREVLANGPSMSLASPRLRNAPPVWLEASLVDSTQSEILDDFPEAPWAQYHLTLHADTFARALIHMQDIHKYL